MDTGRTDYIEKQVRGGGVMVGQQAANHRSIREESCAPVPDEGIQQLLYASLSASQDLERAMSFAADRLGGTVPQPAEIAGKSPGDPPLVFLARMVLESVTRCHNELARINRAL